MLTELHISNLAIIEQQTVSFGSGLNVISGETGAGKSIVLQALDLVLGGKSKIDSIREGAEALEVQALIDLTQLPDGVRELLPDFIEGDELHISRSVNRQGKGKVFLNGKLASVSILSEALSNIISVCSQGQQMRLLDRVYHTEVIDTFGGLLPLVSKYKDAFSQWRHAVSELSELERNAALRESKREELSDRVKELRALKLEAGRREKLEEDVKRFRGSGRLIEGCNAIVDGISGDSGALDSIDKVSVEIERLLSIEPKLKSGLELMESARAQILEVEAEVQGLVSRMNLDENALEELESELAELARLCRKYRTDESGLIELLKSSSQELELIEDPGKIEQIRSQVAGLEKTARNLAEELSKKRSTVGEKLSKTVAAELAELNMPHARMALELHRGELTSIGSESLELMISTNKGEPLRPLRQVASGGELSRVMLILKKVLRDRSGVNVLIFDEIDTGVSGKVARSVGEKLLELSKFSQVICITHLPQIASLADHHLLVEKTSGKRTVSVVRELSEEEKVDEIARMLAGYSVTAASRESARELLSSK